LETSVPELAATPSASPAWRLIPLDDAVAWEGALDGIPHAVATDRSFRLAMHAAGGDPVFLFACDAPAGRFACAIAERRFADEPDVYTPYGFGGVVGTGDPAVFRQAWAAAAAERGWVASYLSLHPVVAPPDLAADPMAVSAGDAWVMDLEHGLEALRERMSDNARRILRRFPEVQPQIGMDTASVHEFFVRTYPAFMRDRGAVAVYDLPEAVLTALVASPATLVVGWPEESPRAAALFGITRWGAESLFAAETPEGRGMMAHLVWAAVHRLVEWRTPWLDLGGGVRGPDGIAEFKRRLGARPVPLRMLRAIHRPETYERLVGIADRAGPSARPGYFPAYHAPRVTSGGCA
jgi:hypothetical protein